jgi:hypothetical protein
MLRYGLLRIVVQMIRLLQQGRGGGYKQCETSYLYLILLAGTGYEYGQKFGLTMIIVWTSGK